MLNLSYNLSQTLKERISKIEVLRREILISPLSPKTENQLRWAAIVNRIYYSLSLSSFSLTKNQIVKTLISPSSQGESVVISYKNALDHISQNWLVSAKTVAVKDVLILYDIFSDGSPQIPLSRIQEVLNYLQAQKEHPVIQAGIASLGISSLKAFSDGNGRLSRLLSLLFLYKHGWDIRGLVVVEKPWAQDRETFLEATRLAERSASITLWLEYFANCMFTQLNDALADVKSSSTENLNIPASFWDLTDRQKEILNLLEIPGTTMTNKKVQKTFKISQITASRDLSKLANLGLVFSHGKGRSIYYTRV